MVCTLCRMLTRGSGSKRRKASRRRRNSSFKGDIDLICRGGWLVLCFIRIIVAILRTNVTCLYCEFCTLLFPVPGCLLDLLPPVFFRRLKLCVAVPNMVVWFSWALADKPARMPSSQPLLLQSRSRIHAIILTSSAPIQKSDSFVT